MAEPLAYEPLRSLVGRRLRLRFDTGASVVGVLLEVRPAVGVPQLVLLKDADVFDDAGTCLQHAPYLPVVPNRPVAFEAAPLGAAPPSGGPAPS